MKIKKIFTFWSKQKDIYRIPNGFHPKRGPSEPISLAALKECHNIIKKKKNQKQIEQGKDVLL